MAIEQNERVTIPVAGMSCAACVGKVENALKGLDGVAECQVNLAASSAGVDLDPGRVSLADLETAVRGVGYRVPWDRIELLVLGMMGTHCQTIIEKAIGEMPGVVSVSVNLGTDTVIVEYAAKGISAARIKRTVRELGYQVSEKAEGEGQHADPR